MIELPEALILSKQIRKLLVGNKITDVQANYSPHKFAWFYKEPEDYPSILIEETIINARFMGGLIFVETENAELIFAEGVNFQYINQDSKIPKKHQLRIDFNNHYSLFCSIKMYGGLWAYPKSEFNELDEWLKKNIEKSLETPSPLSNQFISYFNKLVKDASSNESVKALLATKQRIPGLGNGVLQDILLNAKIHPKRKVNTLTVKEVKQLSDAIKFTLEKMIENKGRDSETDLLNRKGKYTTLRTNYKDTKSCPNCQSLIVKSNFLGGSIYICECCQKI